MMNPRIIGALCVSLTMAAAGCVGTMSVREPSIVHDDAHPGGNLLTFNRDATLLASAGLDGGLRLWRLPAGAPAGRWQAHAGPVYGLGFSKDNTRIVSAGWDGEIAVWSLAGARLSGVASASPVRAMDMRDDVIVTGHIDGHVRVWTLDGLNLLHDHRVGRHAVLAVAWHAAQRLLAASDVDGGVFLWRLGSEPRPLPRPSGAAHDLTFTPDGTRLTGSGWFRLFHWAVEDGRLVVVETRHRGLIRAIDYTADGRTLASISRVTDSSVYLLDPDSGAVKQRLRPHELCGTSVRISPDGRLLASTSDDASVRIFDLREGAP